MVDTEIVSRLDKSTLIILAKNPFLLAIALPGKRFGLLILGYLDQFSHYPKAVATKVLTHKTRHFLKNQNASRHEFWRRFSWVIKFI
jgi:hypothetical protein